VGECERTCERRSESERERERTLYSNSPNIKTNDGLDQPAKARLSLKFSISKRTTYVARMSIESKLL